MKLDTHPNYTELKVTCSCGNHFTTYSTLSKDEIKLDVCNACHPFYTGKHKIIDTAGKVDLFNKRYGNYQVTTSSNEDEAKDTQKN